MKGKQNQFKHCTVTINEDSKSSEILIRKLEQEKKSIELQDNQVIRFLDILEKVSMAAISSLKPKEVITKKKKR